MAGDRASVASSAFTKDALSTRSQRRRYQNPSGEQMECLGIDRWKSQGRRKMISSNSPQKSVVSRLCSYHQLFQKGNEEAQCCSPTRLSSVYCSICTSSPERESIRLDFRASLASLIALNPKWKAQLCFSRGESADGKKFALIFHIRANTERAVETKSQFLWLAKTWLRNQLICI